MLKLQTDKVLQQIEKGREQSRPLIICLIATKACFIKFSGFVLAMAKQDVPFLAIANGQHYEEELKTAADELGYREYLHGQMDMSGGLAEKGACIFSQLQELYTELKKLGSDDAITCVCGDTLSAGVSAIAWYMLTGRRSIHVESGLRSMRPNWSWCRQLLDQRFLPWSHSPTRPFPEGLMTRIASQGSQILFAPVKRNFDNLVSEAYPDHSIVICGSPSVDALHLAPDSAPLQEEPRIRVDIHRRENLSEQTLASIFHGLTALAKNVPIEFVITKTMQNCKGKSWNDEDVKMMEKAGIKVTLQNPSYREVVRFLKSGSCLGLYTDSGGLQEESCVLGIPCMTARYETDRPETVKDFQTNILVPPVSPKHICESIAMCLEEDKEVIWPGLGKRSSAYGNDVGGIIASHLKTAEFEPRTDTVVW